MKRQRYKRKPFKPIDYEKFKEIRYLAKLSISEVACLLHVTPRTIQNWETNEVAIPYSAYKLLRIYTGYDLPGQAWAGWSLCGASLVAPCGRTFEAHQLSYMWLTFLSARNWQNHLAENQKRRSAAVAALRRGAAGNLRLVV
ncbi:MAG: VC1465 family Xer recombination activation factor [Methylotenera sp.]